MGSASKPGARLLKASDHRRMKWKNGLGETIEVAVFPEGGSLDAFGWRVSMASVAADGPFSEFPGIDRTLAILSGDGIRLAVEGRAEVELDRSSAPHPFPADVPTAAFLRGGPVTDLNVMTRRGIWRHAVRRIELCGSEDLTLNGTTALLLCTDGEMRISSAGATFDLGALDALLVGDADGAEWLAVSGTPARFYLIELDPAEAGL